MFLRNLVRSLSARKEKHDRRHRRQRGQQPEPRLPLPIPMSTPVPADLGTTKSPGVDSRKLDTGCDNRQRELESSTSDSAPASRARAKADHPPKERVEATKAKNSGDPHLSASNSIASIAAVTVTTTNTTQHSLIPLIDRPTSVIPTPTSTASGLESSLTAPTIEDSRPRHILTPAFIENEPASNFPFRPPLPQTLPSTTNNSHPTDTKLDHQLCKFEIANTGPTKSSACDETRIAMQRKIWVKRPGASATRVEVNEDDLVDNVRDMILHKYANSLGRHIDSPDITLKIVSREQTNKNVALERALGPEESIGRTLDTYYPGGQAIDEALIIEVPQKRTPKPSPRPGNHHMQYYIPDDYRPGDGAREYFPPMPLKSPHLSHVQHAAGPNGIIPVHSMSVLTTGQVPPLPSPGGQHPRPRHARPKYPRQHTSSPTIMHSSQTNGLDVKTQIANAAAPVPPLPTPPLAVGDKSTLQPPNRTTSPHSSKPKKKRQAAGGRDPTGEPLLPTKPASASLLDGRVPPINVLLVEDNVINLKLLEQFMKRLKVRWKSAMNGREAVNMWRKGGFHLVLMDIQLPIMNGLEATKEIRRLESVNGIGLSVYGEMNCDGQVASNGQLAEEDKLDDRELFKSPVIIVALTASSLQSDRHEALAVGCNDFLTKPVNFVWMERKVTEWGCMQALIDFSGWRKWKEIAEKKEAEDPEKRKREEKEEKAKAKAALTAMFNRPPPSVKKDTDSTNKKEDVASGPSSAASNQSTGTTDPIPTRRSHKGSRSQSGGIGTLGTTVEVDEKEG